MFCKSPFPALLLAVIYVSISLFAITYASEKSSYAFAQSSTQTLDQTYANMQCGFSMNYPSDWTKEELNEKVVTRTDLANFKPSGPDSSEVSLSLEANDITAYPKSAKSVDAFANAEKEIILLIPQVSIEQSERTEVGGMPAYKIVHNNPVTPDNVWKTMNLIIVSGDMQYTLLFSTTSQDEYGKYIPVVDNMIKSIKIDGSKKC
jgi:hypothetical protein